jgi:serine/threonine-protein kinase
MIDAVAGLTTRLHSALSTRYRVERLLGQGGMAVVYLARDLRHDRLVALKLLRPELTAIIGADRFLQEIRVVAQLQHPHILPLFDSGEADGLLFYVMPYVEGESLRMRLQRERQLAIDDAVRIAEQVASALDYAHRQGVIHRDIKPENILLRDAQAVIADFGIALAVSNAGGARLTETGLSLGTPHYMSPEQATGDRELDRRTDIYALGAVLYEMLVGEPPHTGPTAQAVIAKLLTEDAHSVMAQRHTVAAHVDRAIARALAKLPADRWATAGEFAAALGNPQVTSAMTIAIPIPASPGTRWRTVVPWIIAAASLVLTAVFGWRASHPPEEADTGISAALLPPPGEEFAEMESFGQLSPDGREFVFATQTSHGSTRLWLRSLDSRRAEPLDATEGATSPFWSPDGKSIAFFAGNALMRMDLPRGAPRELCRARGATSGVWGVHGEIVFGTTRGLERGSAETGDCKLVVRGDAKAIEEFRHPTILSDGRHVLATSHAYNPFRYGMVAIDLETGDRHPIAQLLGEPTFIAPDLLFFQDMIQARVFVARFDEKSLSIRGQPVPVSDSVRSRGAVASYTVSKNGVLLYLADNGVSSVQPALLMSGSGEVIDTVRHRPSWTSRLAHTKPALALGSDRAVTILDFTRGAETPILSGWGVYPQWSPNDTSIAVSTQGDCAVDVANLRMGKTQRVVTFHDRCPSTSDWSTDARYLIMTRAANDSVSSEIWLHDFTSGGDRPLVTGDADYSEGTVSPDGKWLAYVSNEPGWPEVFVRPFRADGTPERVSTTSGRTPRWRNDSRSLDFIIADGRVAETRVVTGDRIDVGAPRVRFRIANWTRTVFTDVSIPYDMTADGARFVVFGGAPVVAMLEQNVFRASGATAGRK